MRNKLKLILVLALLGGGGAALFGLNQKKASSEELNEVSVTRGAIQSSISTTGTVLPRNRLEVKPPVNGRVGEVLVAEGEKIKAGQVLAWMSSTERAALLDAAAGKGEESVKYWQEVYKPVSLISPIEAEVIVAKTQPGQMVTTQDAVIVLSDQLIVRALVDETDIGKVKQGQAALVSLDAYPDTDIKGVVGHVYYESKTANNVTVYEVDVIPENVPDFFRSGMNASIEFIEQSREGCLLLPQAAVQRDGDRAWVLLKSAQGKEPFRQAVELGVSDDKNVEVVAGLGEQDVVLVSGNKYKLPGKETTTNPFMPSRRRR